MNMINCETQLLTDQKLSSTIFACCLFVRIGNISTIWCFKPYKPNIFWKLMTPTIHWPTDHSPITHTDPPNPPRTQPTWPFLHFMTFCSIQAIYFLKTHGIHYPLAHCIDHFPITHMDPSDPPLHGIAWPSESRTVVPLFDFSKSFGWRDHCWRPQLGVKESWRRRLKLELCTSLIAFSSTA